MVCTLAHRGHKDTTLPRSFVLRFIVASQILIDLFLVVHTSARTDAVKMRYGRAMGMVDSERRVMWDGDGASTPQHMTHRLRRQTEILLLRIGIVCQYFNYDLSLSIDARRPFVDANATTRPCAQTHTLAL